MKRCFSNLAARTALRATVILVCLAWSPGSSNSHHLGMKLLQDIMMLSIRAGTGPVLPLNTAHVYKTMVCRGLRATLFVGEIQRGISWWHCVQTALETGTGAALPAFCQRIVREWVNALCSEWPFASNFVKTSRSSCCSCGAEALGNVGWSFCNDTKDPRLWAGMPRQSLQLFGTDLPRWSSANFQEPGRGQETATSCNITGFCRQSQSMVVAPRLGIQERSAVLNLGLHRLTSRTKTPMLRRYETISQW